MQKLNLTCILQRKKKKKLSQYFWCSKLKGKDLVTKERKSGLFGKCSPDDPQGKTSTFPAIFSASQNSLQYLWWKWNDSKSVWVVKCVFLLWGLRQGGPDWIKEQLHLINYFLPHSVYLSKATLRAGCNKELDVPIVFSSLVLCTEAETLCLPNCLRK